MITEASSKFDRVVSVILTVATLVALALLIERRFNPPEITGGDRVVLIKDWKSEIAALDVPLGDTAGIVKVTVFTDFECPFCSRMDSVLTTLEGRYRGKISRSVIHFPLRGHQFAKPAAVAFECAKQQGRAAQMHHALYSGQATFGKVPWAEYAKRSAVSDTAQFDRCISSSAMDADIEAGRAFGTKQGITGTPAVVINGWLFDPSVPSVIEAAITRAVDGKSPKKS